MKVIKFYADWCGPCKSYAPIFDKVINETKLDFTNVNIDKDISGLAAKYKIKSIPATVFLKDDGTFTKEVGLLSESQLKQLIGEEDSVKRQQMIKDMKLDVLKTEGAIGALLELQTLERENTSIKQRLDALEASVLALQNN